MEDLEQEVIKAELRIADGCLKKLFKLTIFGGVLTATIFSTCNKNKTNYHKDSSYQTQIGSYK